MRSNSGEDEKRNNLRDPTLKDQEVTRGRSGAAVLDKASAKESAPAESGQRTTELGSGSRKSGGDSERD